MLKNKCLCLECGKYFPEDEVVKEEVGNLLKTTCFLCYKGEDSSIETLEHIQKVVNLINQFIFLLLDRAKYHDSSKLKSPEKEAFDKYGPLLKKSTFGSYNYNKFLEKMKPVLDHHYKNNRHHPEHFDNGICDMNLLDIVEMFLDWMAAAERHENGDIFKSLDICKDRFGISPQLYSILFNTAKHFPHLNREKVPGPVTPPRHGIKECS